jgi:hypothetical protein
MQVVVAGKTKGGGDLRKSETFKVSKDIGPKVVELSLAANAIILKNR